MSLEHLRDATSCMGLGVVLALLTLSASSQTTPKPKPISNYMREVGLIYIEQIEDFESKCTDALDCAIQY